MMIIIIIIIIIIAKVVPENASEHAYFARAKGLSLSRQRDWRCSPAPPIRRPNNSILLTTTTTITATTTTTKVTRTRGYSYGGDSLPVDLLSHIMIMCCSNKSMYV